MSYNHLNDHERYVIYHLNLFGMPKAEIARRLKRSASTTAPNLSGTNTGDQDLSEIGVGQTWQDVTASRASGVTYTNTTGKPISAAVNIINAIHTHPATAFVGATRVIYKSDLLIGECATFTFIIPAGSTYKSDYSPNPLESWVELR